MFAVASEHWVHVSLRVEKGGRAADEAEARVRPWLRCLKHGTGFVNFAAEKIGRRRSICPDCYGACAREGEEYGPVWVGKLYDRAWVEEMASLAELRETTQWFAAGTKKLLQTLSGEAQVPPARLFFQRPEAAGAGGGGGGGGTGELPKLVAVVTELEQAGFVGRRTHFDPLALRTDAPPTAFAAAVRRACKLQGMSGSGDDVEAGEVGEKGEEEEGRGGGAGGGTYQREEGSREKREKGR